MTEEKQNDQYRHQAEGRERGEIGANGALDLLLQVGVADLVQLRPIAQHLTLGLDQGFDRVECPKLEVGIVRTVLEEEMNGRGLAVSADHLAYENLVAECVGSHLFQLLRI